VARRSRSDDSVYDDHKAPCRDPDAHRRCSGIWRGVISLGYGPDGRRIRRRVRADQDRGTRHVLGPNVCFATDARTGHLADLELRHRRRAAAAAAWSPELAMNASTPSRESST
jgi:hypothetical protein